MLELEKKRLKMLKFSCFKKYLVEEGALFLSWDQCRRYAFMTVMLQE